MLQTSFCVGDGARPCRFSTERAGEPRLCVHPAAQCMFCDGTTMRTGPLHILLRPLACLYIQDADLYREALQRVSEDSRGRARFLVRRALEMMSPRGYHTILNARRTRAVWAIAALAQNVRDAPVIIDELRSGARQLLQAAPLVKKVVDVPLANILECILGADINLYDRLAETKRVGYSISRHPAFAVDLNATDEEQLAHALSLLMQISRSALRDVAAAISLHAKAARAARWHSRVGALDAAHQLATQMLRASLLLPGGSSLCHKAFEPIESP